MVVPSDLIFEAQKCLRDYNTLALPSKAAYFCRVSNKDQILEALAFAKKKDLSITPLGAGSNIVLACDIDGLVVYVDLIGIDHIEPNDLQANFIDVTFSAGENWHDAVIHCLKIGLYGLENLSLIPGNMGAAVIQNIGAYGVEISDVLVRVDAIDLGTGSNFTLSAEGCQFSYRDSVFKQELRDKCIITSITLRLSTFPKVNIEYPALKNYFSDLVESPTPQMVSDGVAAIRQSKLPDPSQIPNVGSFFKNPIISSTLFSKIEEKLGLNKAETSFYPLDNGEIKVSAAWLIEYCGFKGCRSGSAGVHEHQALVLVNYNEDHVSNSSQDLLDLVENIRESVRSIFDIWLEVEPRIYGSI
jgi:UDP-N-acetylmuramate dehydrogenase